MRHKRLKLSTLLLLVLGLTGLQAQETINATFQTTAEEVVATAGGYYEGENLSLSWTVGEPIIETFAGSDLILTQGFQQPYNFYLQQILNVPMGWSGLSSYLVPADPALETIFGEVMDQVVIVQNSDGIFWPDQSINTLGNWDSFSGYTIKTSSAVTLSIDGEPAAPHAIQLHAGWNLMPVLSPCPVSVDELFDAFPGELVIVKEIAGTGIYWPAQGISTLPALLPGRSYFVLLTSNVFLEFEPCK